jgi:hypothetical protein
MHARVKKLNPHANTPAAVKMNEINPDIIQSKSRILILGVINIQMPTSMQGVSRGSYEHLCP